VAGRLGAGVRGESGLILSGIALASAAVQPGDLFAALPGVNCHGAAFAAAARRAGARAVLTDEAGATQLGPDVPCVIVADPRARLGDLAAWFYGFPARDLAIAGVTGTTGKTTVCYLLEAAMRAAWRHTALLGTVEIRLGDATRPAARTTLEAPDLQGAFCRMRESGVAGCAMEISSHALALHRVDGFAVDVAVFTNLARDHLDYHHTMEDYFAAKAELFVPTRARRAVVWSDNRWGARLAEAGAIPTATVGTQPGAAWRLRRLGLTMDDGVPRQAFDLTGPDATVTGATQLVGDFNIDNAALALVAAIGLGIDPAVAARGIADLAAVPGRMERVAGPPAAPLALVDFAHTPEAVASALGAARVHQTGRVIAVIGAGGGRDQGKRPLMGAAAADRADIVIVTDDNPRDEDPGVIRAAVAAGARAAATGAVIEEVAGRGAAIARAVELAELGDAIVLAGKGHETTQVIGGAAHAWDDRTALAQAIEEHGQWT
jgi:UDP-N-acetylmuramoyl-L-alanyl-D-glutamate--2,6-diaminopimelate ligase